MRTICASCTNARSPARSSSRRSRASTRSRRRSWTWWTTAWERRSISSGSSTSSSGAGPVPSAPPKRARPLASGVLIQYVIAAVITTAEGSVNLLYAPYLDQYGYALPSIGTLSALFAIFRLISCVPTGAAYRPANAKRQVAFWLVVFTIATSGYAFIPGTLPLVVLITVVHGYAFGALGTINLALTIDLTGGQRAGATMGWYTAAISTGYAIGAFAGGALADTFGVGASMGIL